MDINLNGRNLPIKEITNRTVLVWTNHYYTKKDSRALRAASQQVKLGVIQFMDTLYSTPESPCYHFFSEEMYETGLIFYAVEDFEGKYNIFDIL